MPRRARGFCHGLLAHEDGSVATFEELIETTSAALEVEDQLLGCTAANEA